VRHLGVKNDTTFHLQNITDALNVLAPPSAMDENALCNYLCSCDWYQFIPDSQGDHIVPHLALDFYLRTCVNVYACADSVPCPGRLRAMNRRALRLWVRKRTVFLDSVGGAIFQLPRSWVFTTVIGTYRNARTVHSGTRH